MSGSEGGWTSVSCVRTGVLGDRRKWDGGAEEVHAFLRPRPGCVVQAEDECELRKGRMCVCFVWDGLLDQ